MTVQTSISETRVNILVSIHTRVALKELAALMEKKKGSHVSMLEAAEEAIALRLEELRLQNQ